MEGMWVRPQSLIVLVLEFALNPSALCSCYLGQGAQCQHGDVGMPRSEHHRVVRQHAARTAELFSDSINCGASFLVCSLSPPATSTASRESRITETATTLL
jgi:hypothetical protein